LNKIGFSDVAGFLWCAVLSVSHHQYVGASG
jgi:hypothetical protein